MPSSLHLQGEYRAGGRVHTPSRVAPPAGRHQLPQRSSTDSHDIPQVHWPRARTITRGNIHPTMVKPMVLFEGTIEPADVCQGQVGNCWLIAAVACLSNYPGAIMRVFLTREATDRGLYQVRTRSGRRLPNLT